MVENILLVVFGAGVTLLWKIFGRYFYKATLMGHGAVAQLVSAFLFSALMLAFFFVVPALFRYGLNMDGRSVIRHWAVGVTIGFIAGNALGLGQSRLANKSKRLI